MAIKVSNSVVIDDNGAFVIGINSAGVSQTPGPIRTLNFIGTGNTFAYNAATDTIDISISASGEIGAPVINNVTLSEDVNDAVRFTNKGFTADVDMVSDTPVSQKSIKGTITGTFPVYEESTITSVSTSSIISFGKKGDFDTANLFTYVGSDIKCYAIIPTTKGAGNGPGYYVSTYEENVNFTTQYFSRVTQYLWWVSDLTSTTTASNTKLLLGSHQQNDGYTNSIAATKNWPHRTVIVNDIAWNESNCERFAQTSGRILITGRGINCWRDSNGDFAQSGGNYAFSNWTSDGTVAYYLQWSGGNTTPGNVVLGHEFINSSGLWQNAGTISLGTFSSIPVQIGFVYDKPSNKLLVLSASSTSSSVSIRIITVNPSGDITNNGTGGRLDLANMVTNPNGDQFAAGAEQIIHLAYMGDHGSYLTTKSNKLYKYDNTQQKFVYVSNFPNPAPSNQNRNGRGFGGNISDGTLYYTWSNSEGNSPNNFYVYESTDNGVNWTQIISDTVGTLDDNPLSLTLGWSGITVGFMQDDPSNTEVPFQTGTLQTSTITVPSGSFLTNLQNGHRLTKKGDEDSVEFIGIADNKSGNTFVMQSASPYTNSDELINLTNSTQSSTDRYLVVDGTGSVSALQSTDPGFVQIGPGTSISIDFPTSFTNGIAPDNEIPGSGVLKIEVSATNNEGTDTYLSNTVQPS